MYAEKYLAPFLQSRLIDDGIYGENGKNPSLVDIYFFFLYNICWRSNTPSSCLSRRLYMQRRLASVWQKHDIGRDAYPLPY